MHFKCLRHSPGQLPRDGFNCGELGLSLHASVSSQENVPQTDILTGQSDRQFLKWGSSPECHGLAITHHPSKPWKIATQIIIVLK